MGILRVFTVFAEDAHVAGKECQGESIAKLRTPPALLGLWCAGANPFL